MEEGAWLRRVINISKASWIDRKTCFEDTNVCRLMNGARLEVKC